MPFRQWKLILVTSVFLGTLFPLRSSEALRESDNFANYLPSLLLSANAFGRYSGILESVMLCSMDVSMSMWHRTVNMEYESLSLEKINSIFNFLYGCSMK